MNDEKNKKQFVIPEAEILDFSEEDIITMSQGGTTFWGGENFPTL